MIHPDLRSFVIHRDSHACRYCWRSLALGVKITLDHVEPLARGGADEPDNLVVACESCNGTKADALLAEIGWRLLPPLPFVAHEQIIRAHAQKKRWRRAQLAKVLDRLAHPHPDATYPDWMPRTVDAPLPSKRHAVEPMAPAAVAHRRVRIQPAYRVVDDPIRARSW